MLSILSEMQLLVKAPAGEASLEWFIVEMQGDLESRHKEHLEGKFIGDLHYTKEGVPIMIIGHHILYGKIQNLDRPMVTVERTEVGKDLPKTTSEDAELMDLDVQMETSIEYRVKSVIKKKIIFKTRPKPIIANLTKTV